MKIVYKKIEKKIKQQLRSMSSVLSPVLMPHGEREERSFSQGTNNPGEEITGEKLNNNTRVYQFFNRIQVILSEASE